MFTACPHLTHVFCSCQKAIAFAEEKIDLLMDVLEGLKMVSRGEISKYTHHGGLLIFCIFW